MRYLFEPVGLKNTPVIYAPASRTTGFYPGYYHWHECCEMLFVHEGTGTVVVDRTAYDLRPGMLFFFQPYQLHKIYASVNEETPYTRTLLFFNPHYIDRALQPFPSRRAQFERLWRSSLSPGAFDLLPEFGYVESVLRRYDERFRLHRSMVSDEELTILMLQLLEAIPPVGRTDAGLDFRPYTYSDRAMRWVEEHFAEDIHLEDIAKQLHLSKFYLSRLFQRETGGSLSDYIIARRIKHACRLLYTTTRSVDRIAYEVGYPNVSYFIRVFKRLIGTTPLQYRAAAKRAPGAPEPPAAPSAQPEDSAITTDRVRRP